VILFRSPSSAGRRLISHDEQEDDDNDGDADVDDDSNENTDQIDDRDSSR